MPVTKINPLTRMLLPVLRVVLPRHKPSALVIGGKKGGTTSLYHYLEQHPQIVSTKGKELHFFNSDIFYPRGEKFYHAHFRLKFPFSRKISLDVSPGYLAEAEVAAPRIHAYNPGLKLIAVLRNPITCAYSDWQMSKRAWDKSKDSWREFRSTIYSGEWLEKSVPRSPKFGKDFVQDYHEELQLMKAGKRVQYRFLSSSCYYQNFKPYISLFPREQIKIFRSEDLFNNPQKVLRKIEDFLELKSFDWSKVNFKPHNVGGYKDSMSKEALELLRDFFEPEVKGLEKLTGQKFKWMEEF